MNNKTKLVIIILLVSIVIIGACKELTTKTKAPDVKSDKDAATSTSSLSDKIDDVSSDLKEVSRTLGR